MSNIEVKNGDTVNVSGVTTASQTVKIVEENINVSITGIVGGGGSGDAHFTHTQSAASATWSVAHNLGKKPSVMIVDSADFVLHGSVKYIDSNNLTINLSAPTSGKAYLN